MSKQDFIKQIQQLDPKARAEVLEDDTMPKQVKDAIERGPSSKRHRDDDAAKSALTEHPRSPPEPVVEDEEVPMHDVTASLAQSRVHKGSAADARRRRLAAEAVPVSQRDRRDSEDDGTRRIPPAERRALGQQQQGFKNPFPASAHSKSQAPDPDTG